MVATMNTHTRKVVKVTADEFELDNGDTFPHVVEFDADWWCCVGPIRRKCDNRRSRHQTWLPFCRHREKY